MSIFRRRPRKLKPAQYAERWQELQKQCASRKTWPQAVIEADDLVAKALKKAHFKGKTTGERLVAAQHHLSDNEQVWLGHKLRNRLAQEEVDVRKLKKQDVAGALAGFRQALRDLGALEKSPMIEDSSGD
jgi:hypothetical protein